MAGGGARDCPGWRGTLSAWVGRRSQSGPQARPDLHGPPGNPLQEADDGMTWEQGTGTPRATLGKWLRARTRASWALNSSWRHERHHLCPHWEETQETSTGFTGGKLRPRKKERKSQERGRCSREAALTQKSPGAPTPPQKSPGAPTPPPGPSSPFSAGHYCMPPAPATAGSSA